LDVDLGDGKGSGARPAGMLPGQTHRGNMGIKRGAAPHTLG